MESHTIIWLIVYSVLLLLVYIGYGAGIAANDFPNKDDKSTELWTIFGLSIFTFLITMALHVAEKTMIASIFLMISIFLDTILSILIGTTNNEGEYSASLGYISISPIIYKLILFLFVNWDSCGDGVVSDRLNKSGSNIASRIKELRQARNI